jgi:hypothetical protein
MAVGDDAETVQESRDMGIAYGYLCVGRFFKLQFDIFEPPPLLGELVGMRECSV